MVQHKCGDVQRFWRKFNFFSTKQVFEITDNNFAYNNFALTAGRLQFSAINCNLSGIEDSILPNMIPAKACWKSA